MENVALLKKTMGLYRAYKILGRCDEEDLDKLSVSDWGRLFSNTQREEDKVWEAHLLNSLKRRRLTLKECIDLFENTSWFCGFRNEIIKVAIGGVAVADKWESPTIWNNHHIDAGVIGRAIQEVCYFKNYYQGRDRWVDQKLKEEKKLFLAKLVERLTPLNLSTKELLMFCRFAGFSPELEAYLLKSLKEKIAKPKQQSWIDVLKIASGKALRAHAESEVKKLCGI